jgi:hypothetical protein
MTLLASHADQAVRHAVDAYLDGRLRSTFEGDASFETRNSRYRMRDGVLYEAADASLKGAELVGWLIEFVTRSEVSPTWKNGARAVMVDPRNDGVKGPHIVVTSATRNLRFERPASVPALRPATVRTQVPGSSLPQGGSPTDQPWDLRSENPVVVPPARPSPSWGHHPDEPARVASSPMFPPPPALPSGVSYELQAEPAPSRYAPPAPTLPQHRPSTLPPVPPMVMKPATRPPPPPPPRALPRVTLPPAALPQTARNESTSALGRGAYDVGVTSSRGLNMPSRLAPPPPPASVPFLLSRSFQRGMPLR